MIVFIMNYRSGSNFLSISVSVGLLQICAQSYELSVFYVKSPLLTLDIVHESCYEFSAKIANININSVESAM